jgi:hypothetical protein
MDDRQEILDMLTVIYKRLCLLEKKVDGGFRITSSQQYLNELRQEAQKINNH